MGKRILLADDSITIQKVIELTFSDEDFEVVTVGNGRLAIEKVAEVRPDIVLCDIIMPEKDGYEVCDFIKKHPALSSVPVLLLTGAFEPFDQERAARVGCDGFLAKPFEPATLIGKVKDLLSQAGSRRAAAPPPPVAIAPPAMPPAQAYVPPSQPEPMMFPLEPPPTPIVEPVHEAASPVSFIPETPVIEELPEPMMPEEPGAASLLEQELYGVGQAVETTPEEYMPVTPEEVETLSAPADSSATVVFRPTESPWGQAPSAEPFVTPSPAPVETSAPAFEEVFEEELPPALAPPAAYEPIVPAPLMASAPAAAPMAPEPVPSVPEEAPAPHAEEAQPALPPEVSFADVAPPPEPPATAPPSGAANVAVPVDMVAQIAQRVVAQISEKVVREVAWEVIPDLAEALIKKEIERLKAELQNT
jgi:CheY-like chemotaxis protein